MKERILELLDKYGEMPVYELAERLDISRQMLHRHLNQLIENGSVSKIGKSPRVFYKIKNIKIIPEFDVPANVEHFVEEHFIQITEKGKLLKGIDAFAHWCVKHSLPIAKTASEYEKTMQKYLAYKTNGGLIDGIQKLENTTGFAKINVNELYYSDFYAIERFGKTKLGQLLLYAKQGQDKNIIKEIVWMIRDELYTIIEEKRIDAVGFVPPSVKREVQFMIELEKGLKLKLPRVKIEKVQTEIIVPQKTLSKLQDRIANARANIVVTETRKFNKVLLIDDAVGSGATMNETAGKIRKREVTQYIIGYAITGSYKGFEVISEA